MCRNSAKSASCGRGASLPVWDTGFIGLNYRHDAPCVYEAVLTEEMAQEVLALAHELHAHL
ncbi:MAG: hypothetical protein RMK65_00485 [Anaerolineae bacterium]|nr:hypothetical protein [Anaerolineae bacterium]MDW7990632.1 hypothetical protein [Anaerolineae bacterium]